LGLVIVKNLIELMKGEKLKKRQYRKVLEAFMETVKESLTRKECLPFNVLLWYTN